VLKDAGSGSGVIINPGLISASWFRQAQPPQAGDKSKKDSVGFSPNKKHIMMI
jgi:hypothetical protein